MSRDNRVSLRFNDSEYGELKERANGAHLSLGNYIRWFLFGARMELGQQQHFIVADQSSNNYTIPYKASPEVIERIRKGEEPYVDPYQQARLSARDIFAKSGGMGELRNSIIVMSRGGRVLKPIPKKEMKEIENARKERRMEVNKVLNELKEAGVKI